ncbi:MAG: BlaI/MecI/CopY family transcriptional regulator [Planctomycetota bacterium]
MNRKKIPPPLSEAQREIMEIIWQAGEVSVSGVREQLLKQGRNVARNTVQTTIVRLEEKGWLRHRQQGRTYLYSTARSQKQSLGAKVSQLIDRFFEGSPEEMVTALIEYRGLSADEAQRIRTMIEESEKESDQKGNPKHQRVQKRKRGS